MVLAEHEFTLEFPPTSSTGREKFEIIVKSDGKENELASGGESYRAQLAILLALRKALTHQAKCPFKFLLVDEALTYTDETGGRAFGRLMEMLGKDFSQILITAPREIEGVTGKAIWVERRDRVSKVVIGE
jgi:DNA repair exonuclease SbcCD ATPase subunit